MKENGMLFRRKKKLDTSDWEVPYELPPADNIKDAAKILRGGGLPARLKAQMTVLALSRTGRPLFPEFPGSLRPGTVTWMVGIRGSGISEAALSAQFRAMMNGMTAMRLCVFGGWEANDSARRIGDVPLNPGHRAPAEHDLSPYVYGPDREPPARGPMLFIHDGWDPRREDGGAEADRKKALDRALRAAAGFDLVILGLAHQGDPAIAAGRALAAAGKTVILLCMEPYWALGEIGEEETLLAGRCLERFYFGGKEVDTTQLQPGEVLYKAPQDGWPRLARGGRPYRAPYLGFWRSPLMATSCRNVLGPLTNLISGEPEMTHSQALDRLARMAGYSSWMAACQRVRPYETR